MVDVSKQTNPSANSKAAAAGPDLEKVPVDQVLATLAVKPEQGLSTAEVAPVSYTHLTLPTSDLV